MYMGIKSGARWSADPEVDEAVIVPFAAVRTLEKISESCETIFDASHLTEMKRMNVHNESCGSRTERAQLKK